MLDALGSWSPAVRERAALAIARRKGEKPVAMLVEMLASQSLTARYGACLALQMMKDAAAPAVPALKELLGHPDLWLRIQAAEALGGIGQPAMVALPALLERLALPPNRDDPRGMEQRFLCSVVFNQMLKKSLEGVDAAELRKAILAGLKNEDGRARGEVARVYDQLDYEQIKPLLPAIREAIVTPAPGGEMFADGVRLAGVKLLAKHRIKEGMDLSFQILNLEDWGKQNRIKQILATLKVYGGAAKPILPRLRQLEKDLKAHPEARMLQPLAAECAELIRSIENAAPEEELGSLRDLAG